MIRVLPQREPPQFDEKVRSKGARHLQHQNTAPEGQRLDLKPFWRECLDDLYERYSGICAYLGKYLERGTGGVTVDHFIPKSKRPDLAYEWSNYRLACSIMNSRKRDSEDVLDPFEIEDGWFHLELVTGRIYPDEELDADTANKVQATIDRLGLDDALNRSIRTADYDHYRKGDFTAEFFQSYNPFVYFEANRQGLL